MIFRLLRLLIFLNIPNIIKCCQEIFKQLYWENSKQTDYIMWKQFSSWSHRNRKQPAVTEEEQRMDGQMEQFISSLPNCSGFILMNALGKEDIIPCHTCSSYIVVTLSEYFSGFHFDIYKHKPQNIDCKKQWRGMSSQWAAQQNSASESRGAIIYSTSQISVIIIN